MAVNIVTTMLARICKALFAILVMLSVMLPGTINCCSRVNHTTAAIAWKRNAAPKNLGVFLSEFIFYLLLFVIMFHSYDDISLDELNPLTISHTARTISFKANGRNKNIPIVEKGLRPNIPNKPAANINAAPMRPQTDINRGTSLD
jgi:hypothetical protein